MIQAIIQAAIEAMNTAIIVMREADNLSNNARPVHATPDQEAQG